LDSFITLATFIEGAGAGHEPLGGQLTCSRSGGDPQLQGDGGNRPLSRLLGAYIPAHPDQNMVVYVHDQPGRRKVTGLYFTKHFAAEHLLDTAPEPAAWL
jgi:hypothetical protein